MHSISLNSLASNDNGDGEQENNEPTNYNPLYKIFYPNFNDSTIGCNNTFDNTIYPLNQFYNNSVLTYYYCNQAQKEKMKIFSIEKVNKKGRKPKTSKKTSIHTKFAKDNILKKVKVKFFEKILKYLNHLLSIQKFRPLKKVKGYHTNSADYMSNANLLKMKLKDIFSGEIDGKYTKITKYYNRNLIKLIYKKKSESITKVLDWTFLQGLKIYRNKKKIKEYEGFEGLDVVLKELEEEEGDDKEKKNYIRNFEIASKNFEKCYSKK